MQASKDACQYVIGLLIFGDVTPTNLKTRIFQIHLVEHIMKRLIISGLSLFLMVGAAIPAVRAQGTAYNPTIDGRTSPYISQITPFNLVTQAYRGYFEAQGIPGYQGFSAAYQSGQIDAKDLVKSAIAANQLSEDTLKDQAYINAVRANLEDFQGSNP